MLDALVSDTHVAVEIRMTAELPNGSRIDEEVIHLWTFGPDGKVVKLRRMLDTIANIDAARAQAKRSALPPARTWRRCSAQLSALPARQATRPRRASQRDLVGPDHRPQTSCGTEILGMWAKEKSSTPARS